MSTIAIDYTPAIRQQAGIGRIIRGQIRALLDQDLRHDYRLFVVGPVSREQREAAPLTLYATPVSERNMTRLWHRLDAPWPKVESFAGGPLDVLHATDFVLPPSRARRKILTVHDLAFLFYPDAALPSLHHYLNVVVRRSVDRADLLIADSHHTAGDLHREWGVPLSDICIVQGAVDQKQFRPVADDALTSSVRRHYGIGDRPYILALSRLEPRKNFPRLIAAFGAARMDAKLPHMLVIGGSKGWLYEEIFATVQKLKLEDHVNFPGYIKEAHLPALYSSAEFFAYPSLYEGFGLPIVEALACGTPVLTGNNSCLPEAGGPGALYVDAECVDSIASGIIRIATDASLRHTLRQAGMTHAAHFTWERSATQLLSAYDSILA